jgi:hypothetical protein
MSLPVGFVEEALVLALIEIGILFLSIMYWLFGFMFSGRMLKIPVLLHVGFIVFSTFVFSMGYAGGMIPGFTEAHASAYGANEIAFAKAFAFEFVGQLTNQFTGVFLSWIPHATHNFIVSYLAITGLSIGGTALAGYAIVSRRRKKNV